MCLYKGSNKMQIASEDIVCYKIIEIYHLPGGDDYRSYFQRTKIELNEPILPGWEVTVLNLNETNHLYGEAVHAYCNIYCDDSDIGWYIKNTEDYPYYSRCNVSIAKVECIIPKGTMFCKGIDDDDNLCYGALEIIPKRVVETIYSHEVLNPQM